MNTEVKSEIIPVPFNVESDKPLTDEQKREVAEKLGQAMQAATNQFGEAAGKMTVVIGGGTEKQLEQWQIDAQKLAEKRAGERYDPMKDHRVVVRNGIATVKPSCGHRLDPQHEPRHGSCDDCWNMYFKLHPGKLAAAQSALETIDESVLRKSLGKKFLKHVKRIIS